MTPVEALRTLPWTAPVLPTPMQEEEPLLPKQVWVPWSIVAVVFVIALVGVGWWMIQHPGEGESEFDYWQSIQRSRNPTDFERYLQKCQQGKFPHCTYRRLAENSLRELQPQLGGKR